MITLSPTATSVTPGPICSTTPAPSWPSTAGNGIGMSPARVIASVWQTPQAVIRTSASPRPGGARSISCRTKGPSFCSTTKALIFIASSMVEAVSYSIGRPGVITLGAAGPEGPGRGRPRIGLSVDFQ